MSVLLRLGAGVAVLAGVGVAAATTNDGVHAASAARPTVAETQQSTVVCPWTAGALSAPTTVTVADVGAELHPGSRARPRVSVRELTTGAADRTVVPAPVATLRSTTRAAGLAITATGPGADAVAAEQDQLIPAGRDRALLSAACLAPTTDWWITGADGRIGHTDSLALANPGTTAADVTVTAWSVTGRSSPPHLQSYSLPPGTSVSLPVADYVPDRAFVTFHVHANTGRVTAQVLDLRVNGLRAAGGDWIGPTQPPSTQAVVPGFLGGAGPRLLVLTNPGSSPATVGLRLFTRRANFVPAGHQQVVVPAGHSAYVDLSEAFGGSLGAVGVSSDAPVTAAGLSVLPRRGGEPDLQWQPAAAAGPRPAVLAANAPPFGNFAPVYLSAPDAAASVSLRAGGKSTVIHVPAGRTTVALPIALLGLAARGPLLVTPISGGPVYVSRTLFASGTHGPLVTSLLPVATAPPAILPPAVPDPAAAVR